MSKLRSFEVSIELKGIKVLQDSLVAKLILILVIKKVYTHQNKYIYVTLLTIHNLPLSESSLASEVGVSLLCGIHQQLPRS